MYRTYLFLAIFVLVWPGYSAAQFCHDGFKQVIVDIVADNYPQETSWELTDEAGNVLAEGGSVGDTICVDSSECLIFTIYDTFGDGICCGYGLGR